MNENKTIWPPRYKIRQSKKAKNMFLHIIPNVGLEVVVPVNWQNANVIQFINAKRQWIQENLLKYNSAQIFPTLIELRGIDDFYNVSYIETVQEYSSCLQSLNQLTLIGKVNDYAVVRKLLLIWLKGFSKKIISSQLQQLSLQTNLTYNKLTIRNNTTRWGSCSSNKNISLNLKLLFLPKYLFHYVMLHELCHTVELNHSPRFWELLKKFDSLAQLHDKELRDAQKWIPGWLY